MKMKAEDGKLYAEITLRDVVEKNDVSDMPILAEVKRLYAENDKLREQIHWLERGDVMHVLTDQEYIDQCERERLMQVSIDALDTENNKLRELFSKVYGYYVSGTLTPCDFCDKYCCEGDAPTTCKSDEYDLDGVVVEEVERRMRELGIGVS